MNTTETFHHPIRETSLRWLAGGSMMESIGAIATIALAIVGLAGVWPQTMAAIATIIIGAGLLTESGAFSASTMTSAAGVENMTVAGGGASAGFLGGVAGIVLGILALLNIAPPTLLAVALIVFGATFLVSSLAMGQLWSSGGQLMGGIATMVLGIIAVCGTVEFTLVLVGLLCVGVAGLFAGSALGLRAMASRTTV